MRTLLTKTRVLERNASERKCKLNANASVLGTLYFGTLNFGTALQGLRMVIWTSGRPRTSNLTSNLPAARSPHIQRLTRRLLMF